MLQEKLEQESRAAQRRRMQIVIGIAASVAVIGLAYGGIVLLRPSTDVTNAPEASQTAPEAVSRTPSVVPEVVSSAPVVAPDEAASEAARDQFKLDLAAFQSALEPMVTHDDFARWDAAAQRRILDGKEMAISLFSEGTYIAAVTELAAARATAEQALAAREQAFNDALAAAGAAHGDDNYDTASLAIDRALMIRPNSAPAAALKQRIDALPALRAKIEDAAVARVENNLEGERRHLEAALAIDPGRRELVPRLADVRRLLREARFAGHIVAGLTHVEARALTSAQSSLDEAREIYPDRAEVDVLDKKIAGLEIELLIERLTATARAAADADDWATAEQTYIQLRRLAPADRAVTDALARAEMINQLHARAARHLAAPGRLGSVAVAGEASSILDAVVPLRAASPRLAAQADALAGLVAAYGVKVPVRIVSDGKTNITVRGVGIVGKITERTIELRPGQYIFEGIREGFQAVLMRVDIPPGQADLVLEIVPDERI
jgi:tetratricopeptide (TPR) repeat protein